MLKFPDQIKQLTIDAVVTNDVLRSKRYRQKASSYQIYDIDDEPLKRELGELLSNPDYHQAIESSTELLKPEVFQHQETARMTVYLGDKDAEKVLHNKLAQIFEDFIAYQVRKRSSLDRIDKKKLLLELDEDWVNFERALLAGDFEVRFYAHLANFYQSYGSRIEELVPDSDIEIRYLNGARADDEYLWSLLRSRANGLSQQRFEILEAPAPIIIEVKVRAKLGDSMTSLFEKTAPVFDKVCLLIRSACGGGAHFDFITAVCPGNYVDDNLTAYYETNHRFSQAEPSEFRNYGEEVQIQKYWPHLRQGTTDRFIFPTQKLADYDTRAKYSARTVDRNYLAGRAAEKAVDLTQAIESLIGAFGLNNVDYIKFLLPNSDQDLVERMITLRHKYIHGDIMAVRQIIATSYQGNFEKFEHDLRIYRYYVTQLILISIAEPDLIRLIKDYHLSIPGRRDPEPPPNKPRKAPDPSIPTPVIRRP